MELREKLRLALRPSGGPPGEATVPSAIQTSAVAPSSPRLPAELPPEVSLRRVETSWGPIYLSEEWWALDHLHGRLPLRDALALNGTAMSRLAPGLCASDLLGAAFVDVETTGLTGGTGTYVFLVGIGTFEDGSFHLRQFFLAHLGGETAMMAAVSEILADCRVIISFNGRRFDLPLLETRFTLSRLPRPTPGLAHLDLLYPTRHLYRRRLSSCRLASLETALLGVEREDDVPGWAIPGLYFDYLRQGRAEPLSTVFHHNTLDVLSLVALLGHLGRAAAKERPTSPHDCFALGRWDELGGQPEDAARLYEAALNNGCEEELHTVIVRRLVRLYRHLGRWNDLSRRLGDEVRADKAPCWKLEALVELAKLKEHRWRDYSGAEGLTRQALALVEVTALRGEVPTTSLLQREALEHRLWRLRRRLASKASAQRTRN